ncbi:MAG: exodeoxyribonuclease VII small subunit [Candidatus Sericytochromatia bacterium]|nr:exodeoxyribonuclease VII small subunit [Candidatus Sericytochromatia bacterium]
MTQAADSRSYKEALKELHDLVQQLETAQDIDVDALPAMTTRAAELLKFCQQRLATVESEVSRTLASLDPDDAGQKTAP